MEIGLTVAEDRVKIVETDTHIQVGLGPNVVKQDLADLIGCAPGDKCWATALSSKPWPMKLQLCNHRDDPAHEAWDADCHSFTPFESRKVREFVDSLAANAATRK